MKLKLTLIITGAFTVLILACNNHKGDMKIAIKAALAAVDTSMDAGKLNKVATHKADSLMLAYADKFPKDTITPDFILKIAQLQQMQKNYSKANKLLDRLMNDYPDSKAAPIGLYLNGFIYENNEFFLDKAKVKYELFLKKYPNSELIPSVKASLANLGKSPEDIIKDFENKNPKDTAKVPG